jgi:Fe2+ transport system protein FeoA
MGTLAIGTSLMESTPGAYCRVDGVFLAPEISDRLAGLGVSVGRRMRVVRASEPLVVQVYGTRLGLARDLAEQIQVSADTDPSPEAGLR